MKGADFKNWMNVPQWTLHQFAFLRLGYEPMQIEKIQDESQQKKMQRELDNWAAWGPDCPGINHWDRMKQQPHILKIKVDAGPLVKWASEKKKAKIPKKLESLLIPNESEIVNQSLGDTEKNNLLITIALLSKVIATDKSKITGTVDNPNVSEISRRCVELVSGKAAEPTIPNMANSTIRGRIKEGLKILKRKL